MTTRTLVEVSTDGMQSIEDTYIIDNFTECLKARNAELDAIRGFVDRDNYTKVLNAFTKYQTQATRGLISTDDDLIVRIETLKMGSIHYCFSIRSESKHAN